jgi:hypothetical protein
VPSAGAPAQSSAAAVVTARGAAPALAVPAVASADRAAALGAVDALGAAFRRAFTTAIQRLYQVGMVFVAVGALLTFFIPEIPLRGSRAAPPLAE